MCFYLNNKFWNYILFTIVKKPLFTFVNNLSLSFKILF